MMSPARPAILALLILLAGGTASAAAPAIQFFPPALTLYCGENATVKAFLSGDWGGRFVFSLWTPSDVVTVPSGVVTSGNRSAQVDVAAWKPGTTKVFANSGGPAVSTLNVTVLPQETAAIAPARVSTLGGETVTIAGTGFSTGCFVFFDSAPAREVNFADRQTLVATTPTRRAGKANLRVRRVRARARVRDRVRRATSPHRRTLRRTRTSSW